MVSIVVATYRRDESLKAAIISIIAQTYSDIEIVLVDDNADQIWNSKVETIVQDFKNIKYIQNKVNQGSAETRNIGIRASSGEYITFLDDDDVYLPEKVELQVECMRTNNADYCISDMYLYDIDNVIIEKRTRDGLSDISVDSLLTYHLKYHLTGTDTLMFKRDYLIQIGGFPPINVGDEFYLMERAIIGKGIFCYLPRCDVKAYVHTGGSNLSSGDSKINGENELYKFKKKYFPVLAAKDRRFIRMRHYAVLSFAELRSKKYLKLLNYSIQSFLASPMGLIKLLSNRWRVKL